MLKCTFFIVVFVGLGSLTSLAAGTPVQVRGFIPNHGQWPAEVLFAARQQGANVWITKSGTIVDHYTINRQAGLITHSVSRSASQEVFDAASVQPGNEVSRLSMFKGQDSRQWVSVPIYENISFAYTNTGRTVQYHYTSSGDIVRKETTAEDVLTVTPATSTVYGTYLGADESDIPGGIRYLSNGDVAVAGSTVSMVYPTVTGGYSTILAGASDAFIARFDSKLQTLKAYTLIGGSSDDRIKAIAIDGANNIYITGETSSNDFPLTIGVTGQIYQAQIDVFISSLDPTLSNLTMSTYLGGNKDDNATSLAVDQNGIIYVAGSTSSNVNFPVTFPVTISSRNRFGQTITLPGGGANGGQVDGFVASLSAAGRIIQCRYFGVEGVEKFTAMALDASSGVYLTGSTTSPNFETSPTPNRFASDRLPYDRTYNGGNTDAFVVKFNSELALAKSDDGTYSTYFGGNAEEEGRGVFVDALGRAYVVGVTTSTNLPAVGTIQTTPVGQQDIFLSVFSDDGRELASSTYFGGSGADDVYGVQSYNGLNTGVMYGSTQSSDFPVLGAGSINIRAGLDDGFFAVINTFANNYTTLVSGLGTDAVRYITVDPKGDLYYSVETSSSDLPTHDSAFSKGDEGSSFYVAKHAFGTLELAVPRGGEVWCTGSNQSISWQTAGMLDGEKYMVEYSSDGGTTWNVLVKDITASNYQWKPSSATMPAGDRYQFRVSTKRGHVSTTSNLTFVQPPSITSPPVNTSGCQGGNVTLSVSATGANLKYQWRRNGTNIAGATNATYNIENLSGNNVGSYDVFISGRCSPTVTSVPVVVSMAAATSITSQPSGVIVDEGKSFTLTVVAAGGGLSYQWQKNNYDIAGATSATYSVQSAEKGDGGQYVCQVKGLCGSATTNAAEVVINTPNSVNEEFTAGSASLRVKGPNPSDDFVVLTLELQHPQNIEMRLIDQRGAVVWRSGLYFYPAGTTEIPIPLGSVPIGVYGVVALAERGALNTLVSVSR